jgi:hypothetical protein
MTVTDDQISAWLHGSVDAAEDARIGGLIANDPQLSARAAQLGHLDDLVRQAVPLEESLPPELMARLGLDIGAADRDNVISLAAVRAARVEKAASTSARTPAFTSKVWRIAAQVALVVGVGVTAGQWILTPQGQVPEASYRTLGDAPGTEASVNALVKFATATDANEARALASRAGARIIGTQTEAGAWRLAVEPARRDAALQMLRAMPQVSMAEPIDGAAR